MKINTPCTECLNEGNGFHLTRCVINDDGLYKAQCDKGHFSYIITQNEKFELLFEKGMDALNDGYYQEATLCFAATLERFFEWFIKVILLKNEVNNEEIEKTWKYMSVQSERQLGAFFIIYLQEFLEAPEKLNNKQVEFRNSVVHKGHIPKYEETFEYGNYILGYIRDVLAKLKDDKTHFFKEEYMNSFAKIFWNRTNKLLKKYNIPMNKKSISSEWTLLGIFSRSENQDEVSLEKYLDNIKNRDKNE